MLQDGDVGVGVFPEREEILARSTGLGRCQHDTAEARLHVTIWRATGSYFQAEPFTPSLVTRRLILHMRRAGCCFAFHLLFFATCLCPGILSAQEPAPQCPPSARLDNAKDKYSNAVVADPYRWLENQNSSETRAWIEGEQKCTEAALSKLPGRTELTKRLTELLSTASFEPPIERGGRYFFRERAAGQDLYQLYLRRGLKATSELLIDPLPWSADHSASVTLENVSRDGRFVFYGRREGGQDEITLHIMNVDAKRTLPDSFPKADYFAVESTPDNKAVYYAIRTPDGPRAFYHLMGDDPAKDRMIFGKDLGKDKILVVQL